MIKFWIAKELAECIVGIIVMILSAVIAIIISRNGKKDNKNDK